MKKWTWTEAFKNAQHGAKAGVPQYQTFVGYCYDTGRGVKRNVAKARYWYEQAAKRGEPDALFNLAVLSEVGLGGWPALSHHHRLGWGGWPALAHNAESGCPVLCGMLLAAKGGRTDS